MRNVFLGLVAYLLLMARAAAGAEPDYTKYDKSAWRNSDNWPRLVAERRIVIAAKDDAEKKLLTERDAAAHAELRERYAHWVQNEGSLTDLQGAVKRAVDARLESVGAKADRVAVLKEKVEFAKAVEQQAATLYMEFRRAHLSPQRAAATYFRASAELELLRAEKAAKPASK